ncbi:MAG: helix-turn-helix domain-containing protein [Phycisphaeraceae bacterium]
MTDRTPILIVDRDAIASAALARTLAGHGYRCALAHRTEDALAALNAADVGGEGSVGVAIVEQDFGGPEGGLETIRTLRCGRDALVPIVISGFRKVESAVRAMRHGAADYLLKPVIEAELLDAVARATQRHLLLADDAPPQGQAGAADETEPVDPVNINPKNNNHDGPRAGAWTPTPLAEAMKAPERRILLAALEANGWNRQETARQLDINRTTLYKKIRQYRLDEPA